MSARPDDQSDILAEMEVDVRDLKRWAETVCQLGTSDCDPRECLRVVGPALDAVAKRVEREWERALALAYDQQRAGS